MSHYRREVDQNLSGAICDQDLERIRQLVEQQGADVNAQRCSSRSPGVSCGSVFTLAIREAVEDSCKGEEIVRYLINKGADVDVKNSFGDSPLTLAHSLGLSKIVELMRKVLKERK